MNIQYCPWCGTKLRLRNIETYKILECKKCKKWYPYFEEIFNLGLLRENLERNYIKGNKRKWKK